MAATPRRRTRGRYPSSWLSYDDATAIGTKLGPGMLPAQRAVDQSMEEKQGQGVRRSVMIQVVVVVVVVGTG